MSSIVSHAEVQLENREIRIRIRRYHSALSYLSLAEHLTNGLAASLSRPVNGATDTPLRAVSSQTADNLRRFWHGKFIRHPRRSILRLWGHLPC